MKCEFYNPYFIFLYDGYCTNICNLEQYIYNDYGCVDNCKDNNLVLNINDYKCYKQCPENTGLISQNSSVCYNCEELGKNKIGNYCSNCYDYYHSCPLCGFNEDDDYDDKKNTKALLIKLGEKIIEENEETKDK